MVFASSQFAFFFLLTATLYWACQGRWRWQNALLLVANYVFYGWWSWRFLPILLAMSCVSFGGARFIERAANPVTKKRWLTATLILLGATLATLKYYNFFLSTLNATGSWGGHEFHFETVKFLLPIGLSYYVFAAVGYCVDVYRGRLAASQDPLAFFAYLGFFPHLLSGPIPQATRLLPQFTRPRVWDWQAFEEGAGRVIWGLFRKVVVADSLAQNVNYIFSHYQDLSGSLLALGLVMFSVQIYADFAGYSDMAWGLARMLGFELQVNFKNPYFSRNVGEFWRRWHTSLSAWLKDYVYLPLGGRSGNRLIYARNILLTFTFSGLWHGANWTYVLWGFTNGLYFLPLIALGGPRQQPPLAAARWLPRGREVGQMLLTFALVSLSRVFFRSPDLSAALGYFHLLFSRSLFTLPDFNLSCFYAVGAMFVVEWCQRERQHTLDFSRWPVFFRSLAYAGVLLALRFAAANESSREHIYFKF